MYSYVTYILVYDICTYSYVTYVLVCDICTGMWHMYSYVTYVLIWDICTGMWDILVSESVSAVLAHTPAEMTIAGWVSPTLKIDLSDIRTSCWFWMWVAGGGGGGETERVECRQGWEWLSGSTPGCDCGFENDIKKIKGRKGTDDPPKAVINVRVFKKTCFE